MHADPAYNASYRPFLDTLPTADEVLGPEMWAPDMVAALQSPELVRHHRHPAAKPNAVWCILAATVISVQSTLVPGRHDSKTMGASTS
jgi:hypothetical protein